MWVEFVVGTRFALRGFPLRFQFILPQKPPSPNSNSTKIDDQHESQLKLKLLLLLYCNLFIYLLFNCSALIIKLFLSNRLGQPVLRYLEIDKRHCCYPYCENIFLLKNPKENKDVLYKASDADPGLARN